MQGDPSVRGSRACPGPRRQGCVLGEDGNDSPEVVLIMGNDSSYEWESELLGEPSIYPTHPLIVALAVMERFESLDHANEPSDRTQSCKARTDGFVPGAGCAVTCGLNVLSIMSRRGAVAEHEAIDVAKSYWDDWEQQSEKNVSDARHGRQQAERVEGVFVERAQQWFDGKLWPSRWRLARGVSSFAGNRFHRFPDLMQPWQRDFVSEMQRAEGKEVGLASCGGGWFALCVAGDDASRRERVRRSAVVERTAALKRKKTWREA